MNVAISLRLASYPMGTYREQQSSRYVSFPEIISARSVHPHRANSPAANFRRRRHRRRTPVARRLRSALPPVSYVKQAIVGMLRRLAEFRSKTGGILDELPAFGRPIGSIVNFTADCAVRFDLAYRPGDISMLIRGGPCPPATLQTIMLVG